MHLDYQKTSDNIIRWIKKTVHNAGFSRVVIGLSGGIDSSLSAALAVKALGKENVCVAMLPYGQMSKVHVKDAKEVIGWLKIPRSNQFVIDIKPSIDVIVNFASSKIDQLRLGNIMARVRMIYLFDLAKNFNALICGTENKTEHFLGYFTRFGDSASDLEPIQSLYKTQVWEMAKYLGIPGRIISKAPTAGLWENQTDEGELGFTYRQADQILFYFFDKKLSEEEIIDKGIKEEILKAVLKRVKDNEFKRKLPYTL